jgi:hypothetical protein
MTLYNYDARSIIARHFNVILLNMSIRHTKIHKCLQKRCFDYSKDSLICNNTYVDMNDSEQSYISNNILEQVDLNCIVLDKLLV